ncbi:DUF6247 family protein [Streptomyces aidingensis]|uniref:Uncharacterized protein n=1 Tax=Streptomyces aidingensis TaxID=910347 RepID=A0A1I1JGH5_9ACTN|nr:DUF6247 family protein [Streptomyces aidingensis]SFC44540.1 hypothetical protein SAMN05421773_103315 [Streptomyces aidingensis]
MSTLDGAWVHRTLSADDRKTFEARFSFALAGVRLTYEVEPLAEVVREWWVLAGGDQDAADADRFRSQQDATITRRPQRPQQDPTRWVDRTGPAVFAALSPDDRVRFELDFTGAADVAERTFDHRRLLEVIHHWWTPACRKANPEHAAIDREMIRRIEAGDESVFAGSGEEP